MALSLSYNSNLVNQRGIAPASSLASVQPSPPPSSHVVSGLHRDPWLWGFPAKMLGVGSVGSSSNNHQVESFNTIDPTSWVNSQLTVSFVAAFECCVVVCSGSSAAHTHRSAVYNLKFPSFQSDGQQQHLLSSNENSEDRQYHQFSSSSGASIGIQNCAANYTLIQNTNIMTNSFHLVGCLPFDGSCIFNINTHHLYVVLFH